MLVGVTAMPRPPPAVCSAALVARANGDTPSTVSLRLPALYT